MEDSQLRHREVRICHKKGRIVQVFDNSCKVGVNIGNVHQHVTVTREWAELNAEGKADTIELP